MAGYIGSKSSVTLVDGYSEAEADAEFVTKTGDSMTGNLSLGDNNKAIFGAGSDLQIYHDGSNSYISDQGTNDLKVLATDFQLKNAANTEFMMTAVTDGAVTAYHNGSAKLATTSTGIDVTGTVNSDGLTVTQSGSTTATIGATGTSGDNDGTLIINNGGTGDGMLRFDYESNTDRARIGVSASSQNLQFYTAGNNERMRIDSSGNVGIGTSSPSAVFDVRRGDADGKIAEFHQSSGYGFDISSSASVATITAGYNQAFTFETGTTATERMRIDSNGKILINRTSTAESCKMDISHGTSWGLILDGDGSGTDDHIMFSRSGSTRGYITSSSSSVSYNTSSDYRLKENIVDLTGASARVNQLDVKRFNFIADDTNTLVDGFLAHEVATVVPEAITGTKDEVEIWKDGEELPDGVSVGDNKLDADGNTIPKYQGIDQSKLVPLLTAALQEALTEIASLKTRVEALEA